MLSKSTRGKQELQSHAQRKKIFILLKSSDVYEEFSTQGYHVIYNPDGDGNCQFAAIAHHLSSIGIFRSPRTLREEICRYLEDNPNDVDGFSLELYAAVPWNQYLVNMVTDQLTLQAAANLYQIELAIVSSLDPDGLAHILPEH